MAEILFYQKFEGESPEEVSPHAWYEFWEQAVPGHYVVTIKRDRLPASQKQRGVIFGLMIKDTIVQANDLGIGIDDLLKYLVDGNIPKGVGITKDLLHVLMYIICPTTDADGRRITLSKMNTLQASELFERYRNIMAPLGIVIDDPDVNWRNKLTLNRGR